MLFERTIFFSMNDNKFEVDKTKKLEIPMCNGNLGNYSPFVQVLASGLSPYCLLYRWPSPFEVRLIKKIVNLYLFVEVNRLPHSLQYHECCTLAEIFDSC